MAPKSNNNTTTRTASLEEMLATIDGRIEILLTMKEALLYTFAGDIQMEPESRASSVSTQKAPRSRRRRTRNTNGGNQGPILEVLRSADETLTTDELYTRLVARGWHSTSKNPRGVLGVTLRHMWEKKLLVREGSGWRVPATTEGASTSESKSEAVA